MSATPHSTAVLNPLVFASVAGLFIFLWASGFVAAKYGLPYAEPFTLMAARFVVGAAILVPACFVLKASWPRTIRETTHILVAGFGVQTVYLIGVYYGIWLGISTGVTALVVGLQPLLTGVMAGFLLGYAIGICYISVWDMLQGTWDVLQGYATRGLGYRSISKLPCNVSCSISLAAWSISYIILMHAVWGREASDKKIKFQTKKLSFGQKVQVSDKKIKFRTKKLSFRQKC